MAFNPQVLPSSRVDLPPSDDFTTSALKGYQLGRVFAGIPQQIEALKIAQLQQDMAQEAQLHPLKIAELQGQIGNIPYNRSKLVSDILGEPGIVTNADTGPVVPVGDTSMDETMRFAAPEGGGQVPADAVSVGLPDLPGVARSPALRREEDELKDEKFYRHWDYMRANPKSGGTPSGQAAAELAALMETMTPEDQLKVLTLNNSFKSRLAGNPQAMLSVARAIKAGATLDDAQDFLLKSSNPSLTGDTDVFGAFTQSTVKLPSAKKAEVAEGLDNFLQPASPQYDPKQAFQLLKNTVRAGLDEGERKQLTSSTGLVQRMALVKNAIAALPADVRTGLFEGGTEKVIQKLRDTGSPELAELETLIRFGMQRYVNEITGVAFTPGEFDRYLQMFPGITKSSKLNESLLSGLQRGAANDAHSKYSSVFGEEQYKKLRNRFQQEHGFFDELSPFPFKGVGNQRTGPETTEGGRKRRTVKGSVYEQQESGKWRKVS